jgi:hypothetical protein
MLQTVAFCLFWWIAANLVIAGIWTAYCLWPRRRDVPDSIQSAIVAHCDWLFTPAKRNNSQPIRFDQASMAFQSK